MRKSGKYQRQKVLPYVLAAMALCAFTTHGTAFATAARHRYCKQPQLSGSINR